MPTKTALEGAADNIATACVHILGPRPVGRLGRVPSPRLATPEPTIKELLAHFEERFVAHLEVCAEWRAAGDPEPFLLNARKALEAAVYTAQLRAHAQPAGARSLEDLIKGLAGKAMDSKVAAQMQLVRTHTNAAAHVAEPREKFGTDDVDEVARLLPKINAWFFDKVDASRAESKARADAALKAIEHKERTPPDAIAADTAQRLEQVQADLEKTSAVLAQKTRQLERLQRETRNASSTTSGHVGGRILVAGAIGAVAGAVAVLAISASSTSLVSQPTDALPVHPAVPEAALAELDRDAGVDASVMAPDAAPTPAADPPSRRAPPTCPTGMRLVVAGTVEIGQPVGGRSEWPRPSRRALEPIAVGSFCIDREEVTQQELDAWRASTGRTRPERCTSSTTSDFPAVCVTDEEAAQFCADEGGSLPRIAEWEAVARVGGVRTAPGTSEWVEDTFPPALFAREGCDRSPERCGHRMVRAGRIDDDRLPRPPYVLFSWNAPNPEALARGDLSFRCVMRVGATVSD